MIKTERCTTTSSPHSSSRFAEVIPMVPCIGWPGWSGRRRPGIHCPAVGDFGIRRRRSGQSERLASRQCRFRCRDEISWPEGRIPLAEATVYLATSPKSNSAYEGINSALDLVRQTGNLPVPLHLRNAPTKLMKQLGYGKEYKYAHAYKGNFVNQQFLPDNISRRASGIRRKIRQKAN